MSDGGWYGYPPQEPDPYAQAQDDWNRPPLDYGNPPQNPGYPGYGQAGAQPAAQQYYDPYPQQPQQQPQAPHQPQPQPPRGPRPPQQSQDPRYRQPRPPQQSQNPYVQSGQPGYAGGYDTGGYAAPRQPYSAGQQSQPGYEGRPRGGYDTGSYGSGAYETGGYGAQTQSFSSGGYPAGAGAGTGSRRARPAADPYPDQRTAADPYPAEPRDARPGADPRDPRGARDPYGDPTELADDSDGYAYPGRGGRRRRETESIGAAEERGERIGLLTPEDDEDDGDSGDSGRRRGGSDDKPERKRKSCLAVFVAFGILAGILGGGGYYGYKYYEAHYGPPADYSSTTGIAATVVVTIPQNSGGTAIGAQLYQDDVVKSQRAFTKACEANPKCTNIQANTYLLHKEMSAAAAVTALLDTSNVYHKSQLLVRPGERASDVFLDLEQKTGWTQTQILAAIGGGKVDLPTWATAKTGKNFPFANVEGLLFTGTYQLPDYKDPASLIKAMIDKQTAMFNGVSLSAKAKSAGGANLTPYQVLTIASMARAEAGTDSKDLGKIAGVIYHRLKDTADFAHLGFDTTTLYGMGGNTTVPDNKDTANPYNTSVYGIKGLPPGPIDSVDQTTLEAALNPTDSTDLYFCAVNGSVLYATDSTGWAALGKAHPQLCGN